MNPELPIFNEILLLSLRPWMIKHSDTKFKELLTEIETTKIQYNPFFDLDYKKALTNKRKYYSKIINNERINFLNKQIDYISKSDTLDEKLYLFRVLFNTLKNLLKKTSECINEKGYNFEEINSNNKDLADNVYILHLLKFELIIIYIEIQENFKNEIQEDYYSIEDLLELHFNEIDKQTFISQNEKIEVKRQNDIRQKENIISQDCFSITDYKKSKGHINDLFTALANLSMLDESSKKDFVNVFSNKPIEHKIEWIGMKGDLYSFILFLNQEKKLEDANYKHWITTSKIFQLKGKIDFSESDIRSCKPTKKNEAKILKIVQNIRL